MHILYVWLKFITYHEISQHLFDRLPQNLVKTSKIPDDKFTFVILRTLSTIKWIAMKFVLDIHASLRMNYNNFQDALFLQLHHQVKMLIKI